LYLISRYAFGRLHKVVLLDNVVFLVFEYMWTDLYKYMRDLPINVDVEPGLIKSFTFQVSDKLFAQCSFHKNKFENDVCADGKTLQRAAVGEELRYSGTSSCPVV
jgi:hypothetical protein